MKKLITLCLLLTAINLQAQWIHVGPINDNNAANKFETGRLDCIVPDAGFDGVTNQTFYAGSVAGSLWKTTDFCSTWNPILIPDYVSFHGISALATTPGGYMLAATMNTARKVDEYGNIYQYYPATNNWVATNFSTIVGAGSAKVNHIRVCPTNSQFVFAAASTGLYRSTDGGATWALINTGDYENVDFIPANWNFSGYVVYACGRNLVMFSNDMGLTFASKTSVTSLLSPFFHADLAITFDASNPNTRYIYFDVQVWNTSNDSWPSHDLVRLSIDQVTSGVETATKFANISEPAGTPDRTCLAAHDKVMYYGCGGLAKYNTTTGINYSIGNGVDAFQGGSVPYWHPAHPDNHDAIILPSLNKLIYVNDGGCFMNSYTVGANSIYTNSWVEKNNGLNISQIWGLSCAEEDDTEYMTGEQDTKAFRTNAFNSTFYAQPNEPSNVLIDKFNKNNYFQSNTMSSNYIHGQYNGVGFGSEPHGIAPGGNICNSIWADCGGFNCFPGPEFSNNTLFQDPNNPDKIFFGTKNSSLMEFCPSTRVFTFKKGFSPGTWQQYICGMAFTRADKNTVYTILSNRNAGGDFQQPQVFRYTGSDFSGSYPGNNDSWTAITPAFNAAPFTTPVSFPMTAEIQFVGVAASDWDAGKMWVALRYVPGNPALKVIKREAGSWTDYSNGIPADEVPISIIYEQGTNDLMYLGTTTNVYYRDATMSAWAIYSTGLPNIGMNELRINYKENTVRVGTYGQGMWKSDLKCPSSSPLTVTGTTTTPDFYEADNTVTVQNHTSSTAYVKYRSTSVIDFLPNTLITSSATSVAFAFIHGCSSPGNTFRLEEQGLDEEEDIFYEELEKISSDILKVFPNPNDGYFTINLENEEEIFEGHQMKEHQSSYDIFIYNVMGAEVYKQFRVPSGKVEIDLSSLPKGLYTVRCTNETETKTAKVVCK